MTATVVAAKPKRKRSGCLACLGCSGCLFLIAIALVAGAILLPALRADTEELLSGAPDPIASAAYQEVLDFSGLSGTWVTVIPVKGTDEQLAYIVFDETAGFAGAGSIEANELAFLSIVNGLAAANQAQDLNVGVVAVEYRDENGNSLFTFATPQEAVESFAAGESSQADLLAETEVDLASLLGQARQLAEEAGR
jgi:hypothetical protein